MNEVGRLDGHVPVPATPHDERVRRVVGHVSHRGESLSVPVAVHGDCCFRRRSGSTAASTRCTCRPSANDGRGCAPAAMSTTRSTHLVRERVLVADAVTGRPPVRPVRMLRLGDEDAAEARQPGGGGRVVELELVHRSRSNAIAPSDAAELDAERVLAAGGVRVASNEPSAPPLSRAVNRRASSTVTWPRSLDAVPPSPTISPSSGRSVTKVARIPLTPIDGRPVRYCTVSIACAPMSPSEPGAGQLLVEPPGHRAVRVDQPVLQVVRAHLAQLAERPCGDELAGEADRGHPPVAEADHRMDAAGGRALGGLRHPLAPRRPCWRAASRTARACPRRARRSRSRRGCHRGCRCRRGRCRRARSPAASRSRPPPSRSASPPPRRACGSRPTITDIRGSTGRSKNRGATRQAWEWAAPMKPYPTSATPNGGRLICADSFIQGGGSDPANRICVCDHAIRSTIRAQAFSLDSENVS